MNGNWNRSGRRSGGQRPFVIPCATAGAASGDDLVRVLIGRVCDIEAERGIKIDWMSELPEGFLNCSARDVVNAIGRALTKADIQNNLDKGMRT